MAIRYHVTEQNTLQLCNQTTKDCFLSKHRHVKLPNDLRSIGRVFASYLPLPGETT